MRKIKIGILDDHLLFSEAISDILKAKLIYDICFVTNSVEVTLSQIAMHKIDLIILDINIPPYNGLELIPKFKEICPDIRVLILTMYQPCDINLDLETFIGDGYMLKTSGKSVLDESISAILKGDKFIDPEVIKIDNERTKNLKNSTLSKREIQIAKLIVEGKTTKEISTELFISELTIKTHRKNIAEKLKTNGITDFINKVSKVINGYSNNIFLLVG
jgi:DNA-binding NarL/FixJ family response regulator